ncbi:putative short-chain dehydrogenase/reductase SDR [Phytophthora infestans]|uniref:Putative short-chain dehydrogenase/reductase SDR n=1 Tax=Phytophthora infestans TaxID=4787 RepID=A0A833SVR2_PHYIN|nr:putative short-chain dehydrogenase/reductase SDR [Phytophthora infestans]
MHNSAKYTPGQLLMPESKHNETTVYGNSKLYNLLFAFELGRRLESTGISNITSVACHPGATDSSLLSTAGSQDIFLKRWLYNFMNATLTQSTAMGALPTLYATVAPDVRNGDFYGPRGLASMRGYPSLQEPAEIARSCEAAADVWNTTENLLGFKFKVE